ncbi:MAG: ABC transporter substrate-binding protein [Puniceicoccales bacterium]|jgi:iron complex transport system substrate-binding protein|nr:ABC transporter substrate-binding protein [Puniceicoccales bacterium]
MKRLLILALLSVTGATATALGAQVSDPHSQSTAAPATATAPRRVVTLGGPITEIAFALGAEEAIVATDRTSIHPPRAQKLPSVGVYRALAAESVLALKPDKILAGSGLGPPAAARQLRDSGTPLVTVENPRDEPTLHAAIALLGRELGREREAAALSAKLRAQFDEVRQLVAGKPAPRVVFLMGLGGQLSAAGAGTQADGALTLAGSKNIFGAFRGYKPVSEEALLAAAPDFILVATHTATGDVSAPPDPQAFLRRRGLRSLKLLGAKTRFVGVDMGEFLIIGPRAGATTLKLANIFFGTAPTTPATTPPPASAPAASASAPAVENKEAAK